MPGDIILHVCAKNYDQTMQTVPEIWSATNRQAIEQTDGWMEKVTYRGGCPA